MRPLTPGHSEGFTLLEVLVAMVLVAAMAAGVADLFAVAGVVSRGARGQTSTTILATQKMEELRALVWSVDPAGPVSDFSTDISRDPASSGGTGLGASSSDSLAVTTPGFADYVDALGVWVGTGTAPPPRAAYVRRWRVTPAPANPDTLILQVLVTTVAQAQRRTPAPGRALRQIDDALLVSVKTRKAP